jgi:hypothetical protein
MLEDRQSVHAEGEPDPDEEPIPINFDEKTLIKVMEFLKHELEVERMPEIPKPVPSERISDCVP